MRVGDRETDGDYVVIGVHKYGMGVRRNDFAIGDPVAFKLPGNLLKSSQNLGSEIILARNHLRAWIF